MYMKPAGQPEQVGCGKKAQKLFSAHVGVQVNLQRKHTRAHISLSL